MSADTPTTAASGIAGYVTIAEAARILHKTAASLYMVIYRNRDGYRTVRAGNTILIPNDTMLQLFAKLQER